MNVQVKNEIPRCPGAPTFQEIMRSDGGIVKDVLAAQSNPPQSREDIPFEKYISQDFFNAEMKKVWEKVWQYVCREDQVAEAGDYLTYDIGHHSIIVLRDDQGGLKAYHNSCLHRGTKLKPSESAGWSARSSAPITAGPGIWTARSTRCRARGSSRISTTRRTGCPRSRSTPGTAWCSSTWT